MTVELDLERDCVADDAKVAEPSFTTIECGFFAAGDAVEAGLRAEDDGVMPPPRVARPGRKRALFAAAVGGALLLGGALWASTGGTKSLPAAAIEARPAARSATPAAAPATTAPATPTRPAAAKPARPAQRPVAVHSPAVRTKAARAAIPQAAHASQPAHAAAKITPARATSPAKRRH